MANYIFPYQHIIWDWNGTLLDDAWLCIEIMNAMLVRRGLKRMTPEEYEQVFDFPVRDYYQRLGFDFQVEPFEKVSDEFIGRYMKRLPECKLRDCTREVLAHGWRKGLNQYVLSAMKHDTLNDMVTNFKLQTFFKAVTGLNDHHAHGKSDVGRAWLDQQHLDRSTIVMIGDTVHDFEVAQTLGIDFIPIHSGHHSRERLLTATGRQLLPTLMALYDPPTKQ
ncbi:MAG: HAD family hydrolase [Anaerolineae bacterium]|nr:HAD family hydrolase [Anaerolineae bacterium]